MKRKFIFNRKFYKKDIKYLLNWFVNRYGSIRSSKFVDKLKQLGFKASTQYGLSLGLEDLKIPKTKKILIKNAEAKIYKEKINYVTGKINFINYEKKKNVIWNKTNNILTSELVKNYEQTDLLNSVYIMIISGARGNLSQIKQLAGMRGLVADTEGKIINIPIKKNLKEGIEVCEYFISCYGARKGIIDTALKTANSGYLTRKLIYASQQQIIKQPNCNTNYSLLIHNLKKDKNYTEKIKKKIIGRVLAKELKFYINNKEITLLSGQDICKYLVKKIIFCKKIYFRSPLTCTSNISCCQLCYGWNLGNGRMIELGEAVGILAAQSIGEPGTQLTMRTFHTGGVVNVKTNETTISPCSGIISYREKNVVNFEDKESKEKILLTTKKTKLSIFPFKGNKITLSLPKYTLLFVKNKEKINAKQILCEIKNWKIFNEKKENEKLSEKILVKNTISGFIEKKSKNCNKKNLIEITIGNIINYNKLKDKIYLAKGKKVKLKVKENKEKKHQIKSNLNINNTTKNIYKLKTIAYKKEKNKIKVNNLIYTIKKKEAIEKKILINKRKNEVQIVKNYKKKKLSETLKIKNFSKINNLICSKLEEKNKKSSLLIKTNITKLEKNTKIYFKNKSLVKKQHPILLIKAKEKKIKDIIEGLPKIQQLFEINKSEMINEKLKKKFLTLKKKYKYKIATKKSLNLIQNYLLKKIQSVYKGQGINIADKHFEIVIKQMTSKVIVKKEGDSKFMKGDIVYLNKIEKINKNLTKKVVYEPIVLGISKLTRLNEGFLSPASFQETINIITKAAIEGKIDWLSGLKENLILGNLIPIGSASPYKM